MSRRRSTVKARKSQRAAINIGNASIISLTPLSSARGGGSVLPPWYFLKGVHLKASLTTQIRDCLLACAPLPSRRTCGSGSPALPAKTPFRAQVLQAEEVAHSCGLPRLGALAPTIRMSQRQRSRKNRPIRATPPNNHSGSVSSNLLKMFFFYVSAVWLPRFERDMMIFQFLGNTFRNSNPFFSPSCPTRSRLVTAPRRTSAP